VRSCSDCRRVCQEPGSLADELKQLTDSSGVLRSIEDEPSITNCPGDLIPSVATRDSNVQSRATDSPATAACGERNALSISESPQVPRVHLGLVASRETQRHGLRRIAVPAWCALERLTLLKELVGVVLERRRLPALQHSGDDPSLENVEACPATTAQRRQFDPVNNRHDPRRSISELNA
jgi:hypothetical protein